MDGWQERRLSELKQKKEFILQLLRERGYLHRTQMNAILQEELMLDTRKLNFPQFERELRVELSILYDRRRKIELEFWQDMLQLRMKLHHLDLEELKQTDLSRWTSKISSENSPL